MLLTVCKRFLKSFFMDICKVPEEKLLLMKGKLLILSRRIFRPGQINITNRVSLPLLLNLLGLKGKGVEIGVAKGEYSEIILKYGKLSTVYSVDPWKGFRAEIYDDVNNVPQEEQDRRYELTRRKLERYGERSKILRMTSSDAAKLFNDRTFDLIYLDANHSYEEVKKDLEIWWPKLKKGGVFAGHDYLNGEFPQGTFQVKRAVDEFAGKYGQKLFSTREIWPTWYLIKAGI
jgi:hypothetical protein